MNSATIDDFRVLCGNVCRAHRNLGFEVSRQDDDYDLRDRYVQLREELDALLDFTRVVLFGGTPKGPARTKERLQAAIADAATATLLVEGYHIDPCGTIELLSDEAAETIIKTFVDAEGSS